MNTLYPEDKSFSLTRIDEKKIGNSSHEIRLFLVARNEVTRLPYLLSYYKKLGVDRFFIVDDYSEDGSREFLLAQENCHLFEPSNTFRDARAGVHWQNLLLNTFGIGHWNVVIDADELLVYPECETIHLADFCKFLDSEDSTLFFAFMLDMYPENNLSDGVCIPNKPFHEICPLFDKDYTFRKTGSHSDTADVLPRMRVSGGPRQRQFYPYQTRTDVISRAILTLCVKVAEKLRFWKGDKPHYAPALIKIPLIKWQAGFERLSNHVVINQPFAKLSDVTGALLHFKFFADFHDKALKEIARGAHFQGSQEYRRYLAHVSKQPHLSFAYSGSRRYKSSHSLLTEKLIHTTPEYECYVKKSNPMAHNRQDVNSTCAFTGAVQT